MKQELLFVTLASVLVILLLVLANLPSYKATPAAIENVSEDEYYMTMALAEIGKLSPENGYPVGAVVVRDKKIVGRGSNQLFLTNNPTQYAEYIAIDKAIKSVKRDHPDEKYTEFFRDATIYVTLEPCAMDAGKITLSKFKKVVICDTDEDWGSFGSVNDTKGYPHEVQVQMSDLVFCQNMRKRVGWNFEELWEEGRRSAAATDQVPSLLHVASNKLLQSWK